MQYRGEGGGCMIMVVLSESNRALASKLHHFLFGLAKLLNTFACSPVHPTDIFDSVLLFKSDDVIA